MGNCWRGPLRDKVTGGLLTMFNCTNCGKTTQPREPMHHRVVETRPKVYLNGYGEVAGVGTEIVREEQHCVACAKGLEVR